MLKVDWKAVVAGGRADDALGLWTLILARCLVNWTPRRQKVAHDMQDG